MLPSSKKTSTDVSSEISLCRRPFSFSAPLFCSNSFLPSGISSSLVPFVICYTPTTPLKWSNTLTKSSTTSFTSLQFRNVIHNRCIMVANGNDVVLMENHNFKYQFLVLNSYLCCSLLQWYTISWERSEFGRIKDLQQLVSIKVKHQMAGGKYLILNLFNFDSYDNVFIHFIVCILTFDIRASESCLCLGINFALET